MHLEVHPSGQDAEESRNPIDGYERETVLVDTEHHLQTSCYRLDVVVVLHDKITYILCDPPGERLEEENKSTNIPLI